MVHLQSVPIFGSLPRSWCLGTLGRKARKTKVNGCSCHSVCPCNGECALRFLGSVGHRVCSRSLWPPPWVIRIDYPLWSVQSGLFHTSFRSSEKPCFYLVTRWCKGVARAGSDHNYLFYQYDTDTLWYCYNCDTSDRHLNHYFQSTF